MAEITKELGRIPVSRGNYQATTEYYKDNIVQYKRGSYQVVSESPIVGVPPTNDKNVVNPGWTLFAGTLDAQDVVNQIKEQEAQSIQAVADREAEILAKSDAAEVSFDNTGTSLSGINVQDALVETDDKVTKLEEKAVCHEIVLESSSSLFTFPSFGNGYLNLNCELVGSSNCSTSDAHEIKEGEKIVMFTQGTGIACIAFSTNSVNYKMVATSSNSSGFAKKEYIAEADGYVKVSSRTVGIQHFTPIIVSDSKRLLGIESEVNNIREESTGILISGKNRPALWQVYNVRIQQGKEYCLENFGAGNIVSYIIDNPSNYTTEHRIQTITTGLQPNKFVKFIAEVNASHVVIYNNIEGCNYELRYINSLKSLIGKAYSGVYFTNSTTPTFDAKSDRIGITLPSGEKMQICCLGADGDVDMLEYTCGAAETYTITYLQCLVFNKIESKFEIVDFRTQNNKNYIVLVAYLGKFVSGLLAPYYDKQVIDNLEYNAAKIENNNAIIYFAASASPVFNKIIDGVTIKFPITEMRIFKQDGGLIEVSSDGAGKTYEVTNLKRLVFDLTDNAIKVIESHTVTGNYIDLFSVQGNSFTGSLLNYYLSSKTTTVDELSNKSSIYDARLVAEVYPSSIPYIEENQSNGDVYYKAALTIRKVENRSVTMEQLAAELNVVLGKSASGVDGCITIPNISALTYNVSIKKFEIVLRDNIQPHHLILVLGASGKIIDIHPNLLNAFNVFKAAHYTDVITKSRSEDLTILRDNIAKSTTAKFLHLTDLHGDAIEAERIVELARVWESEVDAIVDTGDDARSFIKDGTIEDINAAFIKSTKPVLRVAGNHDAWNTGTFDWSTNDDIYRDITSKVVEQTGGKIVQPSNPNGKNYYYYDINNVRAIVLHGLGSRYWDNEQKQWFELVLSNSTDKHVICFVHAPLQVWEGENNDVCDNLSTRWTSCCVANHGTGNMPISKEACAVVSNFIKSGGNFVGWVGGHTHYDTILKTKDYEYNQLCFASSCAKIGASEIEGNLRSSNPNSKFFDLFNYITIDTSRKLLKVLRLGYNTNIALQEHTSFVYNYGIGVVVSDI